MTRGLNKVMLIGNLGKDPELRYTPSGKPVVSFSLASSRNWVTSDGTRRDATEWFDIVAWGRLAEICKEHLVKGSRIYIEGRLKTHDWADKDGQRHSRVEVVANEMIMLDNRGSAQANEVTDDLDEDEEPA